MAKSWKTFRNRWAHSIYSSKLAHQTTRADDRPHTFELAACSASEIGSAAIGVPCSGYRVTYQIFSKAPLRVFDRHLISCLDLAIHFLHQLFLTHSRSSPFALFLVELVFLTPLLLKLIKI